MYYDYSKIMLAFDVCSICYDVCSICYRPIEFSNLPSQLAVQKLSMSTSNFSFLVDLDLLWVFCWVKIHAT